MFKLMRFSLVVFGSALLLSAAVMAWSRRVDGPVMILSSNFRDNDQSLYFMTASGNLLKQVTHTSGNEQIITTSDDGEWVIVRSQVDRRLYSIHTIMGRQHRLWEGQQVAFEGWTPDRQWVILNTTETVGLQQITRLYRVRPDGDGHEIIVDDTSAVKILDWSPDGEWMYFAAAPLGESFSTINRVHANGTAKETLVQLKNFPRFFKQTLDGNWFYFAVQSLQYEGTRVYRMRNTGDEFQVLTQSAEFTPDPLWSDDGAWLYYSARRQQRTHVYRLSTRTGQEQQLTTAAVSDRLIGWSQDHQRLYFRNDYYPNNTFSVYQMAADGSQQEMLYRQPFLPSNFFYQENNRHQSTLVFSGTRQYLNFTFAMTDRQAASGTVAVSGESHFVGLSADGDWLIFHDTSGHTSERDIYRVNTETGERQTLVSAMLRYRVQAIGQIADNIRLSPDHEWIYYELAEGRGMVALMRMRTDGKAMQLVHRVAENNGGEAILVGWLPSSERELGHWMFVTIGLGGVLGGVMIGWGWQRSFQEQSIQNQVVEPRLARTARISLSSSP